MKRFSDFSEVWVADTEYGFEPGEAPVPRCIVAREFHSGRLLRHWFDAAAGPPPAFLVAATTLFVAFFAPAELGVFLALGWTLPTNVLDLFAEFRNLTNGFELPLGNSLLGALAFHGLPAMNVVEKEGMRALALRGGHYTEHEKTALSEYCEADVHATTSLLERMLPSIDLPRALERGRYMRAVASMEAQGIPVDAAMYRRIQRNLPAIRRQVAGSLLGDDSPFDGEHLREKKLTTWAEGHGIPWPRDTRGRPLLNKDVFTEMAQAYPVVQPIAETRRALSQLHATTLQIGRDGRNRTMLSPFCSITGRNQPSNSRFVFGCPAWMRALVRPVEGQALGYLDYEQQEFGIAAALSGDVAMLEAYDSGDPYLAFAKQVGAVPENATKKSHGAIREAYKLCSLGVLFGMGAETLARRIEQPVLVAKELLRRHRRTYSQFWCWSESILHTAQLSGALHTVLGWHRFGDSRAREPQLRNFPMQANGAEMLRVACCFGVEAGVALCAPVHDALLIEASDSQIDDAVATMRDAMYDASRVVLGGITLRVEHKIVRYPNRLEQGHRIWALVQHLLDEIEPLPAPHECGSPPRGCGPGPST